ncbi:universal stress protein [Pseudozobellia thermophila]|uniref:Nucleotide-binding universal stress protein, UspA family n=1 Tax=Pseudozobellia thermophila TaxID=192903 RepID=A0A1M6IMH6_9FLAO|nr:universal stress protein [Pseudozobellia thermophila]SHJ35638.1 Nucleotide-binding universal stress protein, UspA family [Pseudozobellia thermophila]
MKNILVATDFSNNAYCALFYAAKLLGSQKCTFYLLNVFDELTPLSDKKIQLFAGKQRLEKLQAESEEKLTSTRHRIVLDTGNTLHDFKILSKKGLLAKNIIQTVAEKQIDLVVMGNKGLTEAADVFFGSNTIRVIDQIKSCPVLTIPGEMDFKPPKQIAFITDFKKGCTKKSLAPLLYFVSLAQAGVRVMHITEEDLLSTEQESHRKLLELSLKEVDHSFHWMQAFDDKAKVIQAFLKKEKIDLYAMANHKHKLFERLLREPVIKDISMYADIPFLVLPTND